LAKSWIIDRLRFEHCEEYCEEAIGKASQSAFLTVAFAAKPVIVFATARIVLNADA
jgi:hypothetical protein